MRDRAIEFSSASVSTTAILISLRTWPTFSKSSMSYAPSVTFSLRRRKEKAVEGAYDIEGLENVGQVRRLIHIAVLDTLSLENSIARSRSLAYLAQVALKALEVGEFEERLRSLEAAVKPRDAGRKR